MCLTRLPEVVSATIPRNALRKMPSGDDVTSPPPQDNHQVLINLSKRVHNVHTPDICVSCYGDSTCRMRVHNVEAFCPVERDMNSTHSGNHARIVRTRVSHRQWSFLLL